MNKPFTPTRRACWTDPAGELGGKDTVADLPNFATGGFTIVIPELAPRKRT